MDFVEFIFEDNVLNEIFENKFPSKITRYTVYRLTDMTIQTLQHPL